MKYVTALLTIFVVLMLTSGIAVAQGHTDPPFLQIQSAENPITVDGVLDETDWERRFDHLIFHPDFQNKAGDVEYTVTDTVLVHSETGVYLDTTTTIVKILHYGMDLYIALISDDKYVNKWGDSWEGDGLFMKVSDADGIDREFKLYFNAAGVDPDIVYEEQVAGAGSGFAHKNSGTIVNDTTQIDSGYTAEMVIHLDELGYTEGDYEVPVLMNIFDPDKQTGNAGENWTIGSYYKVWWGSEWGPDKRVLKLADPPNKIAITTEETFTLDGQLNEDFWNDADGVVVAKGSATSSGGWYMQWGNELNSYDDQSEASIKFAHNGTDLYIGVSSNDSSVCEWSAGWEADGLFLWMTFKGITPGPGDRMEVKNMYFGNTEGAGAVFEVNGNVPTGGAEGASYEPAATLTHTETNGSDEGYSLEVVVHTDLFGYSDGDTVMLSTVIWDMDYGSADAFDQDVSDYAPNWWGTQWVDPNFEKYFMYRGVVLSDQTSSVADNENIPVPKSFNISQNYPNPFNPATTIKYDLPMQSQVKVEVFDILGQHIITLKNLVEQAGTQNVVWNGQDLNGNLVGSGVYFYKISTPDFSATKKMILMR